MFGDRDFEGEGEKFSGEPSTGIIKKSSSEDVGVPGGGSERSSAGESSRGENVISWGVTAFLGRYHFPGVGGKPENFSGVTTLEDESSRDVESRMGWMTDGLLDGRAIDPWGLLVRTIPEEWGEPEVGIQPRRAVDGELLELTPPGARGDMKDAVCKGEKGGRLDVAGGDQWYPEARARWPVIAIPLLEIIPDFRGRSGRQHADDRQASSRRGDVFSGSAVSF